MSLNVDKTANDLGEIKTAVYVTDVSEVVTATAYYVFL
jgi:hypothetical protein